jgi:bifunctional UDP-N-acetylglucosamine pyrophosphorylase/glucosamine-1-phosphate N-acetyltransferase
VFELPVLWDALDRLDTSNAQHEYYLTDAPALLQTMGRKVLALPLFHANDILGVNTRQHLAQANLLMQERILERHMTEGVTIVDPRNTYIDGRATIGRDTIIYPFTMITGRVDVGDHCRIGPFTHLRDGTTLASGAEAGAFVELSQTHMAEGARARHHAYLGNTYVGRAANIGAGAITANFDGRVKAQTRIGEAAFVGSGSILIAPVTVGDRATVGAGAVVTRGQTIPEGQTVVGVPAHPLTGKDREQD